MAPVVHQRGLPHVRRRGGRRFHGAFSGRCITRDRVIESKSECGLGHLYAALDQRFELHPAHRLPFPLALQQAQPLCFQEQARMIGVYLVAVSAALGVQHQAGEDREKRQTHRNDRVALQCWKRYLRCLSKKFALALYACSQRRCVRKPWISSGKINCSNSTPCLRSASTRRTVSVNGTLRSSSPWISRTGERQVLTDAMGDDSYAVRAALSSRFGS